MEAVFDFLADKRIIFAVISIVLFLSLIGLLANRKRKIKTKEEVDSQPISMEKNSDSIAQLNIPSTPIEQKTIVEQEIKEPVLEPTLDNFESKESNVSVSGLEVEKEEGNLLVIEDNTTSETNNNDSIQQNNIQPTIAQSENIVEGSTLVIEDNTASETNNSVSIQPNNIQPTIAQSENVVEGSTLVIEDNTKPEENMLIIEDKSNSNISLSVNSSTQIQNNNEVQETLDL